jgi:galactokinase
MTGECDKLAAFDDFGKGGAVQISGDPPMRLLMAFQQTFPALTPDWILQAPGRDMWIAAVLTDQPAFTVSAADLDARATFSFRSAKTYTTVLNRPLPGWARYPAGVLLLMREYGIETTGLQAVMAGSEPPGPRYEHALGITLAALWHEMHGLSYTPARLLELVERVRREYVETE